MRIASFRDDVLWAVAYKLGYDPGRRGLLKNQADMLANFINAWVRRTWDNFDRPEWTVIEQRAPDVNHYVAYDQPGYQVISRPLKVYLVDPRTIQGPVDTHFDLLDQGLHVGWDHGPSVWIKFIPVPPRFTAKAWDAGATYEKDDLAYSPITGECYKSTAGGNIGHDPSVTQIPVGTEVVQIYGTPQAGVAKVNQQWGVKVSPPTWYNLAGVTYTIRLKDGAGTLHTFAYTTPSAGHTLDDLLNGLIAAATASADTWVQALALTKNATSDPAILAIAKAEVFSVGTCDVTGGPPTALTTSTTLSSILLQSFYGGIPATAGTPQVTNVTLPNPLVPAAKYVVSITDTSGSAHTFSYASLPKDGPNEILDGLRAAFVSLQASDTFLNSEATAAQDYINGRLTISVAEPVSVDADIALPLPIPPIPIPPPGPPPPVQLWWQQVPFPLALVETVVRGVYSDALREAGQTDKGAAEEQGASTEDAGATQKIVAPAYDTLTDQQKPAPRYGIG